MMNFINLTTLSNPLFAPKQKKAGSIPKSVIDGTTGEIFIAEVEDAVVGFIHVEEDKTPPFPSVVRHRFACILDFYVTPEYRKRGAGKLLIESVKEWAVSRELEYLELFILEDIDIGKSFYKKENFTTASRTMRYLL